MQITINVEKVDGLFLKQEMGTGKIGDEKIGDEPLSFGICMPTGVPYIRLRGEYYYAPEIFQVMLRAVHEQEGCEPKPENAEPDAMIRQDIEPAVHTVFSPPRPRKPEASP